LYKAREIEMEMEMEMEEKTKSRWENNRRVTLVWSNKTPGLWQWRRGRTLAGNVTKKLVDGG
jgi:hypothetical protein